MELNKQITIYFDDFNLIECIECNKYYHPEDENKHLNSIKHKNKVLENEAYKNLSTSDKQLMKKFKKIMKLNYKNSN